MGYILLAIEHLAVSLLLLTTLAACSAHLRRRRTAAIVAAAVLLTLILFGPFLAAATAARFVMNLVYHHFIPVLTLTLLFILGSVFVARAALRSEADGEPAGRQWPRLKLAAALATALLLELMTFWNLDLAVKNQIAAARLEAGALSLSVAPPQVPDSLNAALIYEKAFKLIGDEQWPKAWKFTPSKDGVEIDPADPVFIELVKSRQPAIELIRRAAAMPDCFFARDYAHPSFTMLLPEIGPLRKASRLLILDAHARIARDQRQTALDDVHAMFRIADHLQREPILITMLVSIGIRNEACRTLEFLLNNATFTQQELGTLRLDESISGVQLLGRAMTAEEAFGIATFGQFADENPFLMFRQIPGEPDNGGSAPGASLFRVFMFNDELHGYRDLMEQFRQAAALPWTQAHAKMQEIEGQLGSRREGMLASMLCPSLLRIHIKVLHNECLMQMSRLALAAARYRAVHNSDPATLAALAPDFIDAVPTDPFDGTPIKAEFAPGKLTLYSLGDENKRTDALTFVLNTK